MSNTRGIYGKYIIEKSDGSKVNPEACYFVLRLDTDSAARKAMRQYARSIRRENEMFAVQIDQCIEEIEASHCNCREAMCSHQSPFSSVWRADEA